MARKEKNGPRRKLKQPGELARELAAKAPPEAVRRFLDCWRAAEIALAFPHHFEEAGLGVSPYADEAPTGDEK